MATENEFGYFRCIPLTVFNTATITSSYAALNGTGFPNPIKILKFINLGTNAVTISFDGVTDHDFLPGTATSTNPIPYILNLQTNHACNSAYASGTFNGREGQIIYGKGTAGTGNLYIIGYY